MILCDIGNTTFHFFDTKNKKSEKIFIDKLLPKKYKYKKIYFISVNEAAQKRLTKHCKKCVDISIMFNFKTKYKGMGIDRQIACAHYDDGIIVDCGSAITVDVMKNGKHKGGFILPGFRSYEKMYKQISPVLEAHINKKVNLKKLTQNTKDAISYSSLQAIVLPIKDIIAKYSKLPCVITGGDGKFLQQYIKKSIYDRYMLFDSMKEIIDAYNCTAKR